MSKKYIIEIEEEPLVRQSALYGEDAVYRASGFKSLVFDQSGLDKLTLFDDRQIIKILLTEKKKIDLKLAKAYDSYCLYPNEDDHQDWDEYSELSEAFNKVISALSEEIVPYCRKRLEGEK